MGVWLLKSLLLLVTLVALVSVGGLGGLCGSNPVAPAIHCCRTER